MVCPVVSAIAERFAAVAVMANIQTYNGPGIPDSVYERAAVKDIRDGSQRLLKAILREYPEIRPVEAGR